VGGAGIEGGACVTLLGSGKPWLEKFNDGVINEKLAVMFWMATGGAAVIPEFVEMLVPVMLPTMPTEETGFVDQFDDTVVLIVDDKVVKVIFDTLFPFNKLLVKLINGDRVVLETLLTVVFIEKLLFVPLFVLETEELLTFCALVVVLYVGKVVVVVLIVIDEFNETVLFNSEVELS
jgi:hypothetical protein